MPDRNAERTEIRRILSQQASIQMLAPRRVGKTWLMHRVAEDLRAQGWTTVFIDLEGMSTEDEFLRELCQKIEECGSAADRVTAHLSQRLRQLIGGGWEGKPVDAIGRIDAKRFSEALVAALHDQGRDAVILVDEIALFVMNLLQKSEQATRDLLYHLRKLRQSYPRVRWIMTGSIGLDAVARRKRLHGALVGLDIFALEPFSETAARAYLDSIRRKDVRWPFALDDRGFVHLARELGWLSPYYLKLIADRIRATGGKALCGLPLAATADIEAALNDLLKPAYREYFATWEEHIDKNFPQEEAALLHAILRACCELPDGDTFETLQARVGRLHPTLSVRALKDLLTLLVNDGFLHEIDGRWRFRSGLLRRYWLKFLHE